MIIDNEKIRDWTYQLNFKI